MKDWGIDERNTECASGTGILPHRHTRKRNCGVPHAGGLRGERRDASASTRRVSHRHAILNEAVMQETYLAMTEEAVGVWGRATYYRLIAFKAGTGMMVAWKNVGRGARKSRKSRKSRESRNVDG